MTRFRATSIALFLAVAALALGACGDDEGSQESATTGTGTTETTTGTTGTGAEDGTTGTTETRERTDRTTTTERERERKKKSSSGSDDSSGSGGGGKSGGGGNSGSSPERELTGKNIFTTSKTVCSNFLPTALAKDLEDGKKSAEDIAKDYSAGYPSAERKRAYDGCLAGLKARG
ncbi:MAG TPA: hypothetical protein VFB51_02840 [Solirubrobacterales bacterium]|nr:hypothetical protein [Solirubrobacterales bacterium]